MNYKYEVLAEKIDVSEYSAIEHEIATCAGYGVSILGYMCCESK